MRYFWGGGGWKEGETFNLKVYLKWYLDDDRQIFYLRLMSAYQLRWSAESFHLLSSWRSAQTKSRKKKKATLNPPCMRRGCIGNLRSLGEQMGGSWRKRHRTRGAKEPNLSVRWRPRERRKPLCSPPLNGSGIERTRSLRKLWWSLWLKIKGYFFKPYTRCSETPRSPVPSTPMAAKGLYFSCFWRPLEIPFLKKWTQKV